MTGAERGFLLLTAHLGDSGRKPLTVAQFRELTKLAQRMEKPLCDRDLTAGDLMELGCRPDFAWRVCDLLEEETRLDRYLSQAEGLDCYPLTRLNPLYPSRVRKHLDLDAPGCLWAKGDVSVLTQPMISLVGSRDLRSENEAFAAELGKQAALQGYTLVSGNARGADSVAQDSCLANGGTVVSVVADALGGHEIRERVLYLSEDDFDQDFSAQRAISRNRIIHTLGEKTFIAQCTMEKGGTWDGTVKNLRFGWSPVFCFDDGSEAARELIQRGADKVDFEDLSNIAEISSVVISMD